VYTLDGHPPCLEAQLGYALIQRVYAEETYKICLKTGAICVDLLNDLREEFNESHFYDSTHNTPAGAKLIGNYLGRQLEARLEFNQ